MRFLGFSAAVPCLFFAAFSVRAASLASCASGARSFLPCELSFSFTQSDLPASTSPYKNDLLRVEFRSPSHKTYLMHAFGDGALRVRFSPTETGTWTYHVLSEIARYNDKEETFSVADSGLPGMVGVANLRHWWTTGKKPHLWLSAAAPFLALSQAQWESWLDARKHDGFTHIRGTLLTSAGSMKPFDGALPNPAYFTMLDERLLAAIDRGFTLDLLLADQEFLASGAFTNFDQQEPVIRYLAARYCGLNVTWQGIERFEDVDNSRALLKNLGGLLQKYDGFDHPRSTDARNSGFPLLGDGWMNYLIEASPNPQLGAVEHQFTAQPEVHVIQAVEPDAFRHELWHCTTNGEYPSVSYQSLQNETNIKAIQAWSRVIADTRHWELEPYFDVDGARAVGLNEVEYLAYAQTPGIVEITLPHHKYNPVWVNPANGEQLELKNYRGEVFSRSTPDNSHDWVLWVPRDGEKEARAKYYYFESEDPPIQEVEAIAQRFLSPSPILLASASAPRSRYPTAIKITRANRASRRMQYAWWAEAVGGTAGPRLLGLSDSGTFTIPKTLIRDSGTALNLRVLAINANGKAYELDRIYQLQ